MHKQIAPTMHKQPLTKEVVAKLYEEDELIDTVTHSNHIKCRKQPGFSQCVPCKARS